MRPKFFYGYVIIALCFVNMVTAAGIIRLMTLTDNMFGSSSFSGLV